MKRKVLIGLTGPLTGPRSAYGEILKRCISNYRNEFEFILLDDMAIPEQAIKVAQNFVNTGVEIVLGHFNSECARAAASIYQANHIPFILIASTAPNLCEELNAYRICASEEKQIGVLHNYLRRNKLNLTQIWHDNSKYGQRLSSQLEPLLNFTEKYSDTVYAVLGSHINVASHLNNSNLENKVIFVPDDCSISEFSHLVEGLDNKILVADPSPSYEESLKIAILKIRHAITLDQNFYDYFNQNNFFRNNQYLHSTFKIKELRMRI